MLDTGIHADQFIDAVQTAALVVVALGLVYALNLLRRELRSAGAVLRQLVETQNQLQQNVRRVWERIDAIEARHGIEGDADTFIRMKRLLDALEPRETPRPPGSEP